MTSAPARCVWCGKQRKSFSEWEQQDIATGEWNPVCNPCATRKLKIAVTPMGAIIPLAEKRGKMTEQERLHIRAELARAMEWTNITGDVGFPPEATKELAYCSEAYKKAICGQMKRQIPDPFTSAADNRALVEWLATDDERWERFLDEFQITAGWQYWLWQPTLIKVIMTAPLDTITLAAAKALGIQGNREYTLLKEAEATGRI